MVKILFDIPSLKIGGGAEKNASMIVDALVAHGYAVQMMNFYSFKNEHPTSVRRIELNEDIAGNKVLKLFARSMRIAETCRAEKIDVVLSFMEEANFPAIFSRLLGNRSKTIISVRNNPASLGILYKVIVRLLYPFADNIVVLSKGIKDILLNDFKIKKNVVAINNAMDIKSSLRLSEEKIPNDLEKWFEKQFIFLSIGSLKKVKSHVHLIRAFERVSTKLANCRLIILGDGPCRESLEKLVERLGLNERVVMPGVYNNIYPFLKRSDCFVFSSISEGFANVVLEALVANIPVISTDCLSGPGEILAKNNLSSKESRKYPIYEKYGILTKPFVEMKEDLKYDPDRRLTQEEMMLSDLMLEVVLDANIKKRYSNVRERIYDFDINAIIRQWIDIIQN